MEPQEYTPLVDSEDDASGYQLIAATAAVLQRYTERSELTLGYARNGEPVPLRLSLDLSGAPTFSDLLERVRAAVRAAEAAETGNGSAGAELDAVVAPHREPNVTSTAGEHVQEHVSTLLRAAGAGPDTPLSELAMLSEREREQILFAWNDTSAAYPDAPMHELVHAQAVRTPERVAVQCAGLQLTYRELDTRANQLAHHLRGLGVGPEVLVGICVERSVDMMVGLLGILKAGGAYVPIDPAYPAERQEYMLVNSQAPVIVTQASLRDGLPAAEAAIVALDTDWPTIAGGPTEAPDVRCDPEQLAYVIYTSGSTGKPKGVQIPHRALVNFLTTMGQTPGLSADDVLVAVTTLSFDIAGLELYLPLITGARVVIAPTQTSADPRALADLLGESGATVMQATPTTWRMLLDSGWPGRPGMKALCGGEALPLALADRLVGAGLELWNMYGPTETTIWSTCAHVSTQGEPLTIGRPIANTSLYILDDRMQPVPVGVAGELWIGGDGLARGYRGRPDLTEERFVPHPFEAEPGARIYRTGDLARYQPDGMVGFLGRVDHQVKVRGFRIELGEIETVLSRHSGVKDAVVVARGHDAEAELAAYVIPAEAPVPALELRQFLARTLPGYMVPATVTSLSEFPLTPNGKVDRKALPEPTRERSDERDLVAPRTDLERRLARIWERELGISPIGVTDNFFDLGVSSIVAATLFAAIEHELGDSLPLGAIFRAPTIASLAELLESGGGPSRWHSLVPIQPLGTQSPIFCMHGGAGTILHLQGLARQLGADQPFYALQSRGLYGGASPLRTVEKMAASYLEEMRQVHPAGRPWRLAGYCFGALVAFELAQRLTAAGEKVELVAMFNGPSADWVRRYGYYGNQPSWRAKRALPPVPSVAERRVRRRKRRLMAPVRVLARIPRALAEPRRLITGFLWQTRVPRTRLLLALGRPVPERDREEFFFDLHSHAEQSYHPAPYAGEILVFSGEGLYEDQTLGWGPLAKGGLRVYAGPGEHTNNRQLMHEPAVGFVAARLQEYLDGAAPAGAAE